MILSPEDRETVKNLRESAVLVEIQNRHFAKHSTGHILVFCGDGDQSVDLLNHHIGLMTGQCQQCRPHLLALNGGALLLSPEFPVAKNKAGRVLLKQIRGAVALKNIQTVVLYTHAPCGAAGLAHVGLLEQIYFLLRAKLLVKQSSSLEIICLFHIDKGEGNKRTYFVSRPAWNEWARVNNHSHLVVSGSNKQKRLWR